MKFRDLWGLVLVSLLLGIFLWGTMSNFYVDTDFGRDLNEMANLWLGRVVWLGPRLSVNFHASPVYYYQFLPALWLSGANWRSVFVVNALSGSAALLVLWSLGKKKWGGWRTVFLLLIVAFSPVWLMAMRHPGNGFGYVIWLLLGLTLVWFEKYLFLQSLFVGMAIALHPAAVVALPLILLSWWRQGKKKTGKAFLTVLGLFLPWLPIIAFEVITRGFLLREWSKNFGLGVSGGMGWENWRLIWAQVGAGSVLGLAGIWRARKMSLKDKWWLGWLMTVGILLLFVGVLPRHYLFGVSLLLIFSLTVVLAETRKGGHILFLWAVVALIIGGKNLQTLQSKRSLDLLERRVEEVVNLGLVEKGERLNLLAVLGSQASSPQADDYRFFFKVRGFNVLSPFFYSESEKLIIFNEADDFKWKSWGSWELGEFEKQDYLILWEGKIEGAEVVILGRQ